jgi:hypothetical protein
MQTDLHPSGGTSATLPPSAQLKPLYVGCATGFSGDRTDGAGPVVDTLIALGGGVLNFETLAERTLALAQVEKRKNPAMGYEPLLDDLIGPVLKRCLDHKIQIVSNFGAANPQACAQRIFALARAQGLRTPRIAVVHGDDLTKPEQLTFLLKRLGSDIDPKRVVSANAYLGAGEIAQALKDGADIVVTGRVSDPSLTLGPAIAHFGWSMQDWHLMGCGTMAGHMLECGTQVTGGYYSVPGQKSVPGMDCIGFPIAEIRADGTFSVFKAANTGGRVDDRTGREQILYEVHDPARYLTPDVVADISQATVTREGTDRILIQGVTGHQRPDELKVNVCYDNGYFAEAEISYAGFQAKERAALAGETIRKRIGHLLPLRVDLIGALSIFGDDAGELLAQGYAGASRDVRLRVAGVHLQKEIAEKILREVTALYCCGPAGGGGVRTSLRPRLDTLSCTIPREAVPSGFSFVQEQRA